MGGVVLAGGRSTRMGTDKALLALDGEPLAVRAATFLRGFCEPVLLAGGTPQRLAMLRALPGLGAVVPVADAASDAGPLAGLVAGLRQAPTALLAVLAVDLPHPSRAVFDLLAGLWRGEAAVIPEVAGRPQPFHAVWASPALPVLERRLAAGQRSVVAAAAAAGARVVGPEVWSQAEPDARFTVNLNRPGDLAAGS
jgi:molybdopterin-guanine dinucleotide biosynthesis protein A